LYDIISLELMCVFYF